jgi:hypothetical protein
MGASPRQLAEGETFGPRPTDDGADRFRGEFGQQGREAIARAGIEPADSGRKRLVFAIEKHGVSAGTGEAEGNGNSVGGQGLDDEAKGPRLKFLTWDIRT